VAAPFTITHGYSKDKRPDLKQFVFSTLCVDRAVPLWGKPYDGNASDKAVNNTLLSDIAAFLAQHGVAPGAYIYVADAALVTEDNLAALGDTLFLSRLPATYNECGSSQRPLHTTPGKRAASSPPDADGTVLSLPIRPMKGRAL
jgi:transposase